MVLCDPCDVRLSFHPNKANRTRDPRASLALAEPFLLHIPAVDRLHRAAILAGKQRLLSVDNHTRSFVSGRLPRSDGDRRCHGPLLRVRARRVGILSCTAGSCNGLSMNSAEAQAAGKSVESAVRFSSQHVAREMRGLVSRAQFSAQGRRVDSEPAVTGPTPASASAELPLRLDALRYSSRA